MNEALGKKAVDTITGFSGVIVSQHEYLYGVNQYGIQSTTLVEGKEPPILYVPVGRVKIVD